MENIILISVQIATIILGLISTVSGFFISIWSVRSKNKSDLRVMQLQKDLDEKQYKSARYLDIIIESYKELCQDFGPLVENIQALFIGSEQRKGNVVLNFKSFENLLNLNDEIRIKIVRLVPFISEKVYSDCINFLANINYACKDILIHIDKGSISKNNNTAHLTGFDVPHLNKVVEDLLKEWYKLTKKISKEISPV